MVKLNFHEKKSLEEIEVESTFYENGQKETEIVWKGDKVHGYHKEWYDNGQKNGEGNYKGDLLDGLFTGWSYNGQKEVEGEYKDGKKVGKWTYYNENGTIKEVKDCDKGECD